MTAARSILYRLAILTALVLALVAFPIRASAAPERYAVLVGADLQKGTDAGKLNGPVNDVNIMRELLVGTYGFENDADHIMVLTGEDATVQAIRDGFRTQLIEKAAAHPGALTVFYFSGHGSLTLDRNGDEGDGVDETLVAYDSRAPGGRDIVDDEIDGWLDELRVHTGNAVFILDSCHSGTATRGDDKVARELPPNPNMMADQSVRSDGRDVESGFSKVLDFITFSGALANELSYEGNDIPGAKGVTHGYLTWSLVQALKTRPSLTWKQTLNDVRRRVGELAPSQHPQVEGNVDRITFDGIGATVPPHVDLVSQGPGSQIIVAAGEPQGLAVGSILAIYAPEVGSLIGPDQRIGLAKVTRVGLAQSTALLFEPVNKPLPNSARITILSVSTKARPPRIKLDGLADQTTTAADRAILGQLADDPTVKELLDQRRIVKVTGGDRSWLYALQRACVVDGTLEPVDRGEPTSGCAAAYYIGTRQSRAPQFSYFVRADDPARIARLAEAIERLENQAELRSLVNENSRLNVGFQLLKVSASAAPDGSVRFEPQSDGGMPALELGEKFTFQIENRSGSDLYVAVLALGTSGAVFPITSPPHGEFLAQGMTLRLNDLLTAGPPRGIETYKLIATTNPGVDFTKWLRGPLQSRDARPMEGMTVDDWMTTQVDVQIRAPPTTLHSDP